MPLAQLPALLLSVLLVGYSPGPCNVFALAMALRHGRAAAVRMWLGMLAGFLFMGTLLLLLVHTAEAFCGTYAPFLKYVGAVYVAFLAWRIYRTRGSDFGDGRGCTPMNGFLLQLVNAKMIVYQLTAYTTFALPYATTFDDLLPYFGLFILAGPGANLVWLLCGSRLHHVLVRHRHAVDTVLALALAACAVMIVAL